MQKRLPMRKPAGKSDIFVSRSTRFEALVARSISLLDGSNEPVALHAMGAAIPLCCSVALAVQRQCARQVTLAVRTTTVDVYDDYEPVVEVRFRFYMRRIFVTNAVFFFPDGRVSRKLFVVLLRRALCLICIFDYVNSR